jgi:hypothetical protein
MLSYQWYYNFAVGVSLEVVWGLEGLSNDSMVVDLAIDSQGNSLITVGKWLSSTIDTNDTKTFVGKNCKVSVKAILYFQGSPILLVLLAKKLPLQSGPL